MTLSKFVETWLNPFMRSRSEQPRVQAGSIDDYVKVGIAAYHSSIGQDESLDDVVGPDGIAGFRSKEEAALRKFVAVRKAIADLEAAIQGEADADPVISAAMLLFPADPGVSQYEYARRVVAQHADLLALRIDEAAIPAPRQPGRPPRDPKGRAAVRSAMHWLSDQGRSSWGNWFYSDRDPGRARKVSTVGELTPVNEAATQVLEAVRRAGVQINISEVRAHMMEYKSQLNQEKRKKSAASDSPVS